GRARATGTPSRSAGAEAPGRAGGRPRTRSRLQGRFDRGSAARTRRSPRAGGSCPSPPGASNATSSANACASETRTSSAGDAAFGSASIVLARESVDGVEDDEADRGEGQGEAERGS